MIVAARVDGASSHNLRTSQQPQSCMTSLVSRTWDSYPNTLAKKCEPSKYDQWKSVMVKELYSTIKSSNTSLLIYHIYTNLNVIYTSTLLNQYSPVPRACSLNAGKDATRAQIYAGLENNYQFIPHIWLIIHSAGWTVGLAEWLTSANVRLKWHSHFTRYRLSHTSKWVALVVRLGYELGTSCTLHRM